MKSKTKIRILLTFAAAAAGFAAGRASASVRICPASCPVKASQSTASLREFSQAEEASEEKNPLKETPSPSSETEPVKIISKTLQEQSSDRLSEISIPVEREKPSAKYVGNRMSKVFHDASCRYCSGTSDKNRIEFDSEKEAKSQGYKPCRRCLPENKKEDAEVK